MTPQDDLTAFLAARLDEDEAVALFRRGGRPDLAAVVAEDDVRALGDPARVLREVAAKRAILAEHDPEPWGEPHPELRRCGQGHGDEYWTEWPCVEVSALAAVYSDHPDYRQEWKSSTTSGH